MARCKAPGGEQPGEDKIEALARDIYRDMVGDASQHGVTRDHLAAEALAAAKDFYAALEAKGQ